MLPFQILVIKTNKCQNTIFMRLFLKMSQLISLLLSFARKKTPSRFPFRGEQELMSQSVRLIPQQSFMTDVCLE